jgi:myo-inositol-1(or 4)-monophosphatase
VSNDLKTLLAIAEQAVDLAQSIVTTHRPADVRTKTDRDTVTDVDLRIEQEVRAFLAKQVPEIGFLGEEEGRHEATRPGAFWVLDPIDGTSNFVHGIPLNAVSLAFVVDEESHVGVIDTPFLDGRYTATKGGGAFVNGSRIKASATEGLADAIVSIGDYAVGPGSEPKNQRRFRITQLLAERVERVRMFGSAAIDLAWLAEGRTDASIMLSNKPWDTAAGVLLAREAGADVVNASGERHSFSSSETIAATPRLTYDVCRILDESWHTSK